MNYYITTNDLGIKIINGSDVIDIEKADTTDVTYTSPFIYFATSLSSTAHRIDTKNQIFLNGVLQTNELSLTNYLRDFLVITGKDYRLDTYSVELGYQQVPITTITKGETTTVITFVGCTVAQLAYFSQTGYVPALKVVGKEWLKGLMGEDIPTDTISIVGSDVTVTILNTNITGAGTPVAGDVMTIGYNEFTITHNLDSVVTLNNIYFETTYGGSYAKYIESGLSTNVLTANTITFPNSGYIKLNTIWKVYCLILKLN